MRVAGEKVLRIAGAAQREAIEMRPGVSARRGGNDRLLSLSNLRILGVVGKDERINERALAETTALALIDEIGTVNTVPRFRIGRKLERPPHGTDTLSIATHHSSRKGSFRRENTLFSSYASL